MQAVRGVSLLGIIVSGLALGHLAAGQTPTDRLPQGMTRGASVEGITEYDLPNGLRVLLFPDPTKTTTTVNMTFLVGSRNEDYGETGMAHLLEHMLFKGSPRHTNVMSEVTAHGSRWNGTTDNDRTNYFETFEGTDTNLEWALDLEADRMVNSFVAKKDLDSEMTVVRNEYESGENNPTSILSERVLSTAYLWHNYGKSTIGARSDIEKVPIERLQAFYHRYYQPDNAVLTIAGHVDQAKTLALVAKYFEPIPRPTRILQKTYTEEPVQDGERTVTLRRVGDSKVMIVGVHVPALASPDGPLASVVGDIFADAPSGRLYKALVATKKAGAVFDNATDSREPGMLLLYAQAPKSADLDDVNRIFLGVMDDVENHPPTDEEVNRSKVKTATQFDLLIRNSERLGLFLSEYIAAGDWRLAFITRDRIEKATTADVDNFARQYLKSSNRTIGLFVPTDKPDRAEIPSPPDVLALVKDYKGGNEVTAGEVFDPSPENIDKRTVRGTIQPGIRLAVVAKKTRGNVVNATMRLHFGDEQNLRGKDTIAALTGAMLIRGTAQHSRQQITDEFNRLKAQVRVSGTAEGANVSIQTTKDNFTPVLNLVAEILREPSFPDGEFETLKQQQITHLESMLTEPNAIAFQLSERHLRPYPKGDVRYVPTMEESIEEVKALKLQDVKDFYAQFYGVAKSEFAAVGDVDAESLQKQLGTLFHDWKSKSRYERVTLNYRQVPQVNQASETPDKANAVFVAVQPVKLDDENSDYPALLLANYMLGGSGLDTRLAARIRVKDGLSYGVASQLEVPTKDNGSTFMAYAIAAPQNVAKVEADFNEEVKRAIQDGFTAPEVSAAKIGWLQSQQVSRGQDNELARNLVAQTFWDRTMAWDKRLDSKISALTPDAVNAALRKYFDPTQISVFKAGDFAKAKTAPANAPATK